MSKQQLDPKSLEWDNEPISMTFDSGQVVDENLQKVLISILNLFIEEQSKENALLELKSNDRIKLLR